MSFTISYDIKAVDQFSAVGEKIAEVADRMSEAMKRVSRSANTNQRAFQKIAKTSIEAHAGMAQMARKSTDLSINMEKVNSASKRVEASNKRAARSFDQVGKAAQRSKNKGIDAANALRGAGSGMESLGNRMTMGVTMPIIGAGIASVKFSNDLNKGMANVGTLIPGQTERLKDFKKEIQNLSVESGFSTGVLSEGLYQTISALGDAGDPMAKLKIATMSAKAGVAETKDAMELLAMTTKAYGDTSDAAMMKVSDLAFQAVKLGVTTFPELSQSMGSVVSKSAALGISQEEIFAGYAALTGVVGNTSEVSTQLAGIMGGMLKPTKGMKELMDRLGFSSAAAMMQEKGLAGSLDVLQKATEGSVDKLGELFESKEALNSLIALTGKQSDSYSKKLREMAKASGSTKAAFDAQTKGINKDGEALERAKRKVVVLAQSLGGRLTPLVVKATEKFTPLADKILAMSDAQIFSAGKTALMVAAFGPMLAIVGKTTTMVGSLVSMIGGASGLSAVAAIATGPVGIAAAAIAALGMVTYLCWDDMKSLRDAISGPLTTAFGTLKGEVSGTSGMFSGLLSYLKMSVGITTSLAAPFVKLGLTIAMLPVRWFIKQLGFISRVVGTVAAAINALGAVFNYLKNLFFETVVGQTITAMFEGIGSAADWLVGKISFLWDKVSGFFNFTTGVLTAAGIDINAKAAESALKGAGTVSGQIDHKLSGSAIASPMGKSEVAVKVSATDGLSAEATVIRQNQYANTNVGKNIR